MILDTLDIVIIIGYILCVTPMFISLAFDFNQPLQTVGDWLIMLTHFLVIPPIIVSFNTKWYTFILLYSLVTSIIYHLSKLNYIGMIVELGNWDISAQNGLMLSTLAIIIYYPIQIPDWIFCSIAGSALLIASIGEVQIVEDVRIFEVIGAIAMLSLIAYLVFRVIHPTPLRNIVYIIIATILSFVACVTFFICGTIDQEKYSMCHSIWHISAYVMLYFLLKSINNTYQTIRSNRTSF